MAKISRKFLHFSTRTTKTTKTSNWGWASDQMTSTHIDNDVDQTNSATVDCMQDIFYQLGEGNTFDGVAKNVKVVSVSPKNVVVELRLGDEHLNGKGILHGGQIVALVDIVTALAVGVTIKNIPIVSLDISVSYMLPMRKGETIIIEAVCLKIGRNIAFTEAIFRRKSDDALIAKGRHNIAILRDLKPWEGQARSSL